MDKNEDAFRTISEAAEELDLPQHVLRFWETRFPQIRPLKRGGGRRYYRPEDVDLLRAIRHLLYSEGYTIKGVQRMLREKGLRTVLSLAAGEMEASPDRGNAAPVDEDAFAPVPDEFPGGTRHAGGQVLTSDSRAPSPVTGPRAPQQADGPPLAAAEPAPACAPASAFSAEQGRALRAIAAELSECRRILAAAVA
jgi:DNA-binding transcriptional MerR regulator